MTQADTVKSSRFALFGAVLVAALSMAPLYWALISSLRPSEDIFRYISEVSLWMFVPNRITFDNLINVWSGPFARAMMNSVIVDRKSTRLNSSH